MSMVEKKMNQRDKILRKVRRSKKSEDWKMYRDLRNSCDNDIKQAKHNYNHDVLNENTLNPKAFCKKIKEIFPCKSIRNSVGSRQPSCNAFNRYYSSLPI